MIKKCEICNKRIHKNIKYVQCSDCRKVLHFSCLNDSCNINSYSKKHFSCVKCTLQNLPFRSCFDVDVLTLGNNVLNSSQSTFINDLKSHQPSLQFNDIDNLNNINSHYVNIKEFNNIINSNTLEIVHLNIASLNKHIDELHNFLSLINKKINLIGITEHKLNASNSLYNGLPGYNFVFTPTISSHGGAGFFVSNNLNFKLRSDLEIKKPQLCESIFIEVNFNKQKNIIFGCIYRHPSTSITDFNENFLTPLLQKLSLEKISCCLMGDFNINLLKTASNTCVSVFYQMMSSSFFTPHILQPTRITSNTQTLIDNIFFNSIDFKTSSGNLEYHISDHLIQYFILDSFKHFKSSNNIIKRRCFRYFNHDEFQNDLLQVDWERISTIAEIDSCFENFLNSFEYLLDEHAPFKTFTKKEKSLFTKPWITNDIKNKMILRDKMFRKFCQCKNVVNKAKIHLEYKNLRNDIIQITKKSKLVYFHKYFQKNKLNISKTWEGTNSLISKKRKSHNSPLSVNHNGKLVNDLHDVVENLYHKLSQAVGMISKLRHYAPLNVCLSVYYALFFSYLHYGCLSWQFTKDSHIEKLRVLQRKALRILTFSSYEDSTNPLFYLLNVLKVDDVFSGCIYNFFFNLYHREIPCSLEGFFSNFSSELSSRRIKKHLKIPSVKTVKFGENSLRFNGVKCWNSFVETYTNWNDVSSILSFKIFHKKTCLDKYLELSC